MSSIYKRKDSPYFWWQTTYKGKRIHKSTKMTRKDLAKKVSDYWDLKLIKDELDFLPNFGTSQISIKEFIFDYLKFIERRKPQNTFDTTKGVLLKFQEFVEQNKITQLNEITVKVIDAYIDWLDNAPKTKKNYHGIVSRMLKQAVKEGIVSSNPAELATLPKVFPNPDKHRMLEPIDLDIIFTYAGEWFTYYQFLLYTGLRAGDVATLRYRDINRQKKAIVTLIHKPNRFHELPLSDHLINQLNFCKNEDPIFPSLYSEIKKQVNNKLAVPRKHLQEILRLNSRPKATLHSFRKTFNNILRDLGLDIGDRQKLLAHSSSETTKIYTVPNFERAKEFIDKIPVYGKSDKNES